jgi:glutamate dehydrogenase
VAGEIAALRPGVSALLPQLESLYLGVERESLRGLAESLVEQGVPAELAGAAARLSYGSGLLDIVEVAGARGCALAEVAGVYFALSERFRVDTILSRISALPRPDRWQALARMALRYDLYAALAALTSEVLAATAPEVDPVARVFQWEQLNAASIAQARTAIGDVGEAGEWAWGHGEGGPASLAALSVLLRQIRTLVRTTGS